MENTQLIQHKCSTCGAPLDKPNAQRCSYCMMSQKNTSDLNFDQQAFLCSNCGSYLNYNRGGFECEYCHSTFSLNDQTGLDKAFFGKQEKLDLDVSKEQAKRVFYDWLAKNDLEQGKLESFEINSMHVPYMIATIDYKAAYSVAVGQESWGPYIESDGVEKKRKIIEWQTQQDHIKGSSIKSYLITKDLSLEVQSFAKKIDCIQFNKRAVSLKNEGREDGLYLTVSSESVETITRVVKKHIPVSAKKLAKTQISGDKIKEPTIDSLNYEMSSDYLYVPFWQILYRYEGKEYQVLITGMDQTEMTIDGSKPTIEKVRSPMSENKPRAVKSPFSLTILLIFIGAIAVFKTIRWILTLLLAFYLLGCLLSTIKNPKAKENNP
jgi:DNA-directed RNA polymerase subunit RPC12/RpoP